MEGGSDDGIEGWRGEGCDGKGGEIAAAKVEEETSGEGGGREQWLRQRGMNGKGEDGNLTYLEIASETSDFIGKIVILFTYFNIKTNISFNDLKNVLKVFNFKIAYMIGVFNFKNVRTKNFFYNLPYFSNKDEKYSILLSKFTKKTQSRMYSTWHNG